MLRLESVSHDILVHGALALSVYAAWKDRQRMTMDVDEDLEQVIWEEDEE